MKILFAALFLLSAGHLFAQTTSADSTVLPYREIPAYPDSFSAENVAARMIDGLGFRYYWATEGLRPEDLAYRPGAGASLTNYPVVFINGDKRSEFPFWNMINGPIADALWHVGQVVSFRRSSGNPFNSKVSVFGGKVRE